MLAILATLVGAYALTDFVPSEVEYQLRERIRRSAEKRDDTQFVTAMRSELLQERNARLAELLTAIGWSSAIAFLAIQASRRALRKDFPSMEFEPRAFQPFRPAVLGSIRSFSSAFLARGERIAIARSNLRPTIERLFGSKVG